MKSLRFFIVLLVIGFVPHAFAGGYQRTKDGKALVWNNRPQVNDIVIWSGETDDDGYATGPGTLTWYTGSQQVTTGSNIPKTKLTLTSKYTGKMVHGKLEGPVVNVDADGRTYHGTFVNGHKSNEWFAGPPGKDEKSVAKATPHKEEAQTASAEASPEKSPAATAEKSNEPIVETPAEGPPRAKSTAKVESRRPSPPPSDDSATGNRPPSHDVDDSLRSLVGPPPALQPSAQAQTSPPPQPSTPPKPAMHLSGARVATIADAEARAQGYNVDEYRRSEAIYNQTDDSWAISYEQTMANGVGKRFTVTVADKSEKATISSR